jgi:ribosome biogenesis GTPase
MAKLINDCYFNNCLHIDEPGCAVKKAVEEGRIDEERFFSYFKILETIEEKEY